MDISKDEFKKMQDKYKSKHPDGTQAVHFPKKSVDRDYQLQKRGRTTRLLWCK